MSVVYVVINRPATYEDFSEDDGHHIISGASTWFTILSVCENLCKAREAFCSSEPEQGELIALYQVPFNQIEFEFQILLDKKTWTTQKTDCCSKKDYPEKKRKKILKRKR